MTVSPTRQHVRERVTLNVAFQSAGVSIHARTRDISLGGAFIETDKPLAHGTSCVIELSLPALRTPVRIEAIVRWTAPDGMGVQWGALGAKESWAINQLSRRSRAV